MAISKKYSIKKEFLEFHQPPLENSISSLKKVSQNFKDDRLNYQWNKEVSVKTHTIKTFDNNELAIIELVPKNLVKKSNIPAIFYTHGGGFFSTYSAGQLDNLTLYCLNVGCKVFLVQYRLSTEAPFPGAFNDCYGALEWIVKEASSLLIDKTKLLVLGDSAGGALAAGITEKANYKKLLNIKGMFLIYPALDCDTKTNSAKNFIDTPVWTTNNNKIMWEVYLRNADGIRDFNSNLLGYASPSHSKNLKVMPKTYVEISEFDPVRDEAIAYVKSLEKEGVDVEHLITKGTIHAFDFVDCNYTRKIIESRASKLKELLEF